MNNATKVKYETLLPHELESRIKQAPIACEDQAKRLIEEHLLNVNEFWRPYPIPATAANEKNYVFGHAPGDIGCSWRAHTWIPSNYFIFHGLMNYGYSKIAKEISDKTFYMVTKSGDCEYYGSEEGLGCGVTYSHHLRGGGFLGSTNQCLHYYQASSACPAVLFICIIRQAFISGSGMAN